MLVRNIWRVTMFSGQRDVLAGNKLSRIARVWGRSRSTCARDRQILSRRSRADGRQDRTRGGARQDTSGASSTSSVHCKTPHGKEKRRVAPATGGTACLDRPSRLNKPRRCKTASHSSHSPRYHSLPSPHRPKAPATPPPPASTSTFAVAITTSTNQPTHQPPSLGASRSSNATGAMNRLRGRRDPCKLIASTTLLR